MLNGEKLGRLDQWEKMKKEIREEARPGILGILVERADVEARLLIEEMRWENVMLKLPPYNEEEMEEL